MLHLSLSQHPSLLLFKQATFPAVVFSPGNLTAEAIGASAARLATHTVHTAGSAAQIRLSLDAPSVRNLPAGWAGLVLVRNLPAGWMGLALVRQT